MQKRDKKSDTKEELNMADVLCERKVVGTLMTQNWAYSLVMDRLQVDLFTDPLCRECMIAILQLESRKATVDFITVNGEVSKQCDYILPVDVMELAQEMLGTPEQLQNYIGRLHDLLTRRRLFQFSVALREMGESEMKELDDCMAYLRKESDKILGSALPAGSSTLNDSLSLLESYLLKRQDGEIENTGSFTGFPQFDCGGGFLPGQLIVLGAGPSQGKTALALTMVDHIISQHIPVAYFSLEMPKRDLAARYVAMHSGVPLERQLNPSQVLSTEDFNAVAAAIGALDEASHYLYFDDNFTADINNICAAIRCLVYRKQVRGVVVDYLQILNTTQSVQNREQFMGDVARMLKNIALELDIWVLALSQLNRDKEQTEPTLSRLRDSGQIAEAADVVALLYRPEQYNLNYARPFENVFPKDTALLNVAKNRNGRTSREIIGFQPERTLFRALSSEEVPQIIPAATCRKNAATLLKF